MDLERFFLLLLLLGFLVLILAILIGVPYLFLFGGTKKFLRKALLHRYEGLTLHATLEPGDVQCVYHTYRGLIIWFTQDEHRIIGPPDDVLAVLKRLWHFNLTWGMLSYGALFIPLLATTSYLAQRRAIEQQAAIAKTGHSGF
jgi:hypothetical protein